jgi:hypothetical protein
MNTPSQRGWLGTHWRKTAGLAAVAILGLAACSGDTAPRASGGEPGSGTAATATAATVSDGSGSGAGAVDVCAVVTAADVASLYAGPVTAKTEPGLAGESSGCQYIATRFPDAESLSIEVVSGDQAAQFWTGNIPPQGEDSIPLGGIGDRAMRMPGTPDLVSIKGSIFCEAETGSANAEIYVGLATPNASDNVPDDSATAFAERIGALCNKIFAGLGTQP